MVATAFGGFQQWTKRVNGQGNQHDRGVASAPARGALPRVHLASRSPRRRELLTQAGIAHDASHPGLDDALLQPGDVPPADWAMALAYLKAATAVKNAGVKGGGGAIAAPVVLGADTVIVHHGRMIGTPTSAAEAGQMLREMRDDEHEVITGIALVCPKTGRRDLAADGACVALGSISDQQIDEYVATGAWAGKAGGYNLSERLAAGWPIRFRGDSGTIMGLPVGLVVDRLARFGLPT